MALSFSITSRFKEGKYTRVLGTIAWDNSYPTGGESFQAGLGDHVLSLNCNPYKGYSFEPDYANKKIIAYAVAVAGSAAAAGTDALSLKASVINKESAGAMTSGLNEVHSTKDLSALTAAPFSALLAR